MQPCHKKPYWNGMFSFFFFLRFIYLQGKERDIFCLLVQPPPPQVAATGLGQAYARRLKLHVGLPCKCQGPTQLKHLLFFQEH